MKNTACGDFSDRRFEQTYVPGKPFGLCNLPSIDKGEFVTASSATRAAAKPRCSTCWPDTATEAAVLHGQPPEIAGPSLERGVVFQSHALRMPG
jgi:hypothetical protein